MVGEKLKRAREAAGMTQEQVAGMMNVATATVSRWENNKRGIGIEEMKGLSKILGVSYEYFLGEREMELPVNIPATRADIHELGLKIETCIEGLKEVLRVQANTPRIPPEKDAPFTAKEKGRR